MNCNDCCYNLPKDGHSYCTYEEGECVKISTLEKENAVARKIIKMLHNDCYSIAECEDTNLGFWEDDLAKAKAFLDKEIKENDYGKEV
jgi:hypothetical protein